MGNTAKQCRLGTVSGILTSREILKIENPLLEEHYVFWEATHLFQQVGCARKKHQFLTAQQNLKLSLDTGLRLDGLPALELWDLIVSVFGNISHISDPTGQPVNGKNKSHNKIDVFKTLILFPQMSNPQVVKLYCMCLRTMRL